MRSQLILHGTMKPGEQSIAVFVISLRRARERREQIMAHLDALGVDYEIVDAVDGAAMSDAERTNLLAPGRTFHPGVIGCYVSHINVYRLIVERSLPMALILEDDARLKSAFVPAIQQGLADHSFDLLLLDCAGDTEGKPVFIDLKSEQRVFEGFHSYEPHVPPGALHAYIISRGGALRRLECAYPIQAPIDVHTRLPYTPRVRILFAPKGASLSELNQQSSTSHRNIIDGVRFRALRKYGIYKVLRDFIQFEHLRRLLRVNRLVRQGVLSPQGKWRQLPGREWIL